MCWALRGRSGQGRQEEKERTRRGRRSGGAYRCASVNARARARGRATAGALPAPSADAARRADRLAAALRVGVPGYRVRVIGEDRATLQILVSSEGDERRPG